MHTRTASDQVTALLIAGLLVGGGSLLDVPRLGVAIAAVVLYGALIAAFTTYRRSLLGLQPVAPVAANLIPIDATSQPSPDAPGRGQRAPSRRRLHAA